MKKVKAYCSFGYVGTERCDEFLFDDDATENEINEEVWEWASSYVDCNWEVVDE